MSKKPHNSLTIELEDHPQSADLVGHYPAELPCANPACNGVVEWKKSRGRPSRFCSPPCQQQFNYQRRRLLRDLERTEKYLGADDLGRKARLNVTTANAFLRWHLAAYGGVPGE